MRKKYKCVNYLNGWMLLNIYKVLLTGWMLLNIYKVLLIVYLALHILLKLTEVI